MTDNFYCDIRYFILFFIVNNPQLHLTKKLFCFFFVYLPEEDTSVETSRIM